VCCSLTSRCGRSTGFSRRRGKPSARTPPSWLLVARAGVRLSQAPAAADRGGVGVVSAVPARQLAVLSARQDLSGVGAMDGLASVRPLSRSREAHPWRCLFTFILFYHALKLDWRNGWQRCPGSCDGRSNVLRARKGNRDQRGCELRRLGPLVRGAKGGRSKIERLKRDLTAAILRSIEGLSARQAESITGLHATTISRLRRGIDRDYSLELLVRAAIKIGVPVDILVGEAATRTLPTGGRQGMYRTKEK
jgi:hypothetical protein